MTLNLTARKSFKNKKESKIKCAKPSKKEASLHVNVNFLIPVLPIGSKLLSHSVYFF